MALQNLQKAVDMETELKKLKDTVMQLESEVERLRGKVFIIISLIISHIA